MHANVTARFWINAVPPSSPLGFLLGLISCGWKCSFAEHPLFPAGATASRSQCGRKSWLLGLQRHSWDRGSYRCPSRPQDGVSTRVARSWPDWRRPRGISFDNYRPCSPSQPRPQRRWPTQTPCLTVPGAGRAQGTGLAGFWRRPSSRLPDAAFWPRPRGVQREIISSCLF